VKGKERRVSAELRGFLERSAARVNAGRRQLSS
jgi:hypothetical protein